MKQEAPEFQQVQTPGELGEVVRRHRKARQLTQRRVAGLTNVSAGFLSDFENGKPTTEIGKILSTLNTLGLDVYLAPRGLRSRVLKDKT